MAGIGIGGGSGSAIGGTMNTNNQNQNINGNQNQNQNTTAPNNDTFNDFGFFPREADCEYKCPEIDACISENLWCDGKCILYILFSTVFYFYILVLMHFISFKRDRP